MGKGSSDQLPKIVATFVYASSQGQRTHFARTKIEATFVSASSQRQRTHSAQTNIFVTSELQNSLLTAHQKEHQTQQCWEAKPNLVTS